MLQMAVHDVQVLVLPSENVDPLVHGVIVAPPGQALPGGQLVHTRFVVDEQAVVS